MRTMGSQELISKNPKLTVRMSFNERNEFHAACRIKGTDMSSEVMKFIRLYIEGDRAILERLKERYKISKDGE